ncbi:hypothetical protein AMATHDRAFT_48349 [Amanita thiersii Skay4041]|uniref:Uncharacterized protein n=1 Tax=Amanita thiersii Skay4041 TaxID=703135 RepID=A0A2A9NGX5_9AGAR|nr:hypothetical protein AMATHDRAFT_48349 [Amanita thiersii Skay4041]
MSNEKDKNRLFITLQLQPGKRGFHWGILLAPKRESTKSGVQDCHFFHVRYCLSSDFGVKKDNNGEWRYEHYPVNVTRLGEPIVMRVLVAKLPASESLAAQAERVNRVVGGIQIRLGGYRTWAGRGQRDEYGWGWSSRVWVWDALGVLRALGGEFGSIPTVVFAASGAGGGVLERDIKAFAERVKGGAGRVTAGSGGKIAPSGGLGEGSRAALLVHPKYLPQMDVRGWR